MIHIKELMKKVYGAKPVQFSLSFKRKSVNSGYRVTEQDKRHIRIIATLKFAQDRSVIQAILDHEFTEKFEYIKESEELVYTITLKKGGKHKEYANC